MQHLLRITALSTVFSAVFTTPAFAQDLNQAATPSMDTVAASGFDRNTALVILVVVALVIVAAWWYTKDEDEETSNIKQETGNTRKKAAKKTRRK